MCLCLRVVGGVGGGCGCLGVGCGVWGGGLRVWLGGVVASGGVGVGFVVGLRAFVFGGVGVPVSGSARVGFWSVHVSGSGSVSASSFVVSGCGGVRVCSVGARRCLVFRGVPLVVGWWVGVAGVGGVKVGVLLGFGLGSGYVRSVVSGGVVSSRGVVWFAFFLAFACLRWFCVFAFACWWWAWLVWGLVCVCVIGVLGLVLAGWWAGVVGRVCSWCVWGGCLGWCWLA